jgi:hypothetical protein
MPGSALWHLFPLLPLVARCERAPNQTVLIGDKTFRGKAFETELATLEATIIGPRRKVEKPGGITDHARARRRWPASRIIPHSAATTPSPRPASPADPPTDRTIFWTLRTSSLWSVTRARTLGNLRVHLCVDSRHSTPRSSSTTTSTAPAAASSALPHNPWHKSSSHA